MRPDGGCILTAVFPLSGKEHHHLLHLTIAVPVVVSIIHLFRCQFTSLSHHLSCSQVLTVSIILTIIGIIHGEPDRSYHIEIQQEPTFTLVLKIVMNTAMKAQFMFKPLFVRYAPIKLRRMCLLKGTVSKLSQDDETLEGAIEGRRGKVEGGCVSPSSIFLYPSSFPKEIHRPSSIFIRTSSNTISIPKGILPPMLILVTPQLHTYRRTI